MPAHQSKFLKITDTIYRTNYAAISGHNLYIVFLLMVCFFVAISYFRVMVDLKSYQADWKNQRCRPGVIPFAGPINGLSGHESFRFTGDNFTGCVNDILTKVADRAFDPIKGTLSVISSTFALFIRLVDETRKNIALLSAEIKKGFMMIIRWFQSIDTEIRKLIVAISDIVGKMTAVLATSFYALLGMSFGLKSFLGAVVTELVTILIAMSALVLLSWIFVFTWPVAVATTASFVLLAAAVVLISEFMRSALQLNSAEVPGSPAKKKCFAVNTMIGIRHPTTGSVVATPIQSVHPGDRMADDSLVTAVLELDFKGETMYQHVHTGTRCTGTHRCFVSNGTAIDAANHPDFKPVPYEHDHVFSLNTSSKQICVEGVVYTDWDDVTAEEFADDFVNDSRIRTTEDIHTHLDGGFLPHASARYRGNSIHVEDIEVGMTLDSGDYIAGKVWIDTAGMDLRVASGQHSHADGFNLKTGLGFAPDHHFVPSTLIHFVTNTGTVTVSGVRYIDYYDSI